MAASYFLMFSQKSSTLSVDLSEKNKAESKIIRMLPDKKTSLCLHRNTADTAVPEKQTIDHDTIPMKQIKTTDTSTKDKDRPCFLR